MPSDDFIVTPWHVEGKIDYDKLIKQFGTEKITAEILKKIEKTAGEIHFMLRRGIFFSHRDLGKILDEYQSGKKFFLYTGRGPSGHTHIGHLVPWVFAKWLQEKFQTTMYFQLTDDEKFYAKENLTLEQTKSFAYENALDFIALGFKPENTKIIINTNNIRTLYPIAAQVAKKINFSNTKAVFGFKNETNIGMIFYTSLQSAPCFIEDRQVLIPLGVDQDPHFRITRDVAPKIGRPKPALIHNIMIPSLTGPGGKMSASEESGTIYTTDAPQVVKKKINKYAFSGGQPTVEEHRRIGGNPDIDVSYQYLRIFFEPDDKKLKSIYDDYKSGKMLTGELKAILIDKVNSFLEEHQQKREKAKDQIERFLLSEK
ncbi:MAG: tryptophan--tRNA ligase [Candidatus Nitrosotenuis sp.]|uniref:Tryptophan--tRNA ligase n=1 Tax=Candidatus Nitrosotenuis uzonensis TaxID=1407055 RepID=A0A812F6T6_9ARCH|nr:tryptophan--tRNA ligase [Candidatus Nitrosotenuis uzonensis]MCA2003761.1 tryptophan--tRNA ligase [Candidatus Nitrosotenuis sp.]CAE6495042.1 Tryptophan--tRNA ligase [Candidatus Nitrosotenuis uzonensis]